MKRPKCSQPMTDPDVWRLLDFEFENPYANLAVEEAIPTQVGRGQAPNTVRFWRNLNAVVIGRFQSATMEVSLEACKRFGTTIVRRFTGGGAVYHDQGNLNYAIAVDKHHRLIKSDLGETFKMLSMAVIGGLETLGIAAEFEPPNSLRVNERKIGGAAGAIRSGFVFYHGSILVNSNLETLSEVLNPENQDQSHEKRCVRSIGRVVSNLSIELERDLSIQEVKEALQKGFERKFRIKLVRGDLTQEEKRLGERLLEEKYSTDAWNFAM